MFLSRPAFVKISGGRQGGVRNIDSLLCHFHPFDPVTPSKARGLSAFVSAYIKTTADRQDRINVSIIIEIGDPHPFLTWS
jgi:hypothetical protein